MNYIKPNSVPGEIKSGGNIKQKRQNIEKFLKALKDYGVPKELLFEVDDLLLLRNLPKVTRCMFALGKLVSETLKLYFIFEKRKKNIVSRTDFEVLSRIATILFLLNYFKVPVLEIICIHFLSTIHSN